ncbi:MAG: AAA family ATPase, partial [Actinomycetota bacterium]|nr:AAA family ATPase [Actinomycetota bacterium]
MGSAELLERDAALVEVRQLLKRAAAGSGTVGLVLGEAGIGKTALLDASAEAAGRYGLTVLRARASQLDRRFGFGVIRQLLEPALDALDTDARAFAFSGAASGAAVLFEGDPATDLPDEPEFAVLNGLFRLIVNLAEESPLLISVDDVQWADVPTVRALEFLARRIDSLPLAVLMAERTSVSTTPSEGLDAIRADSATVRIDLKPLSRESADRIVSESVGRDPDGAFLDSAWDAVGGNPLLLDLACREIEAHGLHGDRDEAGRLADLVAPGLAPIVQSRLRTLGPETGHLALVAAVLGDRSRFDDLVSLSELPPEAVRDGLNRLADAHILIPGGTRFVHELVKAAVVSAQPAAELDRLHRLAARRLRLRHAPAGEIALHRFEATPA